MVPSLKRLYLLFALLGTILLASSVALMISWNDHRADLEQSKKSEASQRASDAAKAIDAILQEIQRAGEEIISGLDNGRITAAAAPSVIRSTLEKHSFIWGLGIVYDPRQPLAPFTGDNFHTRPEAFKGNNYYTRPGGVIREGFISYDYTNSREPRAHWWLHAFKTGPGWIPPYLGGTSGRLVTLYTAPFYGPNPPKNGMPAGVILVSLRLDTLNRTVGWSELAADGYGLIVSRSGSYAGHPSGAKDGGFIAHPVKSYWRGSSISSNFYAAATFPEVARQTGNTQALKVLEPSSEGSGQTVLDYKDEVTKQDAWLFYSSIPTADWVLGYVLPKGVAVAGDKMDFRFQLWIVILIIAGVSLMIAAGTALMTRKTRQLWALAAIMTLAPIVAIGFIWNLSMAQENKPGLESSGVSLRQTVDEYKKYVSSVSPKLKVETVLAGVFLDTIKQKENRIDWEIAGTMWQRYLNGVPDGTKPGFLLPDAVNPPEFKSLYDMQSGSIRSIGWRFSATIRPKSDQSQYPIDNILVTLRFVHSQIERPIVLLPDVGEYDLTIPSSRPGLASSLVINGFRIKESYFNYVASNSNSTLGIPDFARQKATPEVEFKVQLSRNFLDPFISQMLPLIVVLGLLFAVHLMSTRPGEWQFNEDPNNVPGSVWQRVWYGRPRAEGDVLDEPKKNATSVYYTQATLTTVLGLMFVVIFSHHSLRTSITSSEIIYLEYAYFVVYAALAMVTLNSLLFAAGRGGFIVQWRRNLIPELMYWPCITVAILIVTIILFY